MGKRIVIIQGHPDPVGGHLCHGLADSYAKAKATYWLEKLNASGRAAS